MMYWCTIHFRQCEYPSSYDIVLAKQLSQLSLNQCKTGHPPPSMKPFGDDGNPESKKLPKSRENDTEINASDLTEPIKSGSSDAESATVLGQAAPLSSARCRHHCRQR